MRKLRPERGNDFLTVTQLVRGQPGFKPEPLVSQAIALSNPLPFKSKVFSPSKRKTLPVIFLILK